MNNSTFLEKAMRSTSEAVDKRLDKLLKTPRGAESQLFEAMRYSLFAGGKRSRNLSISKSYSKLTFLSIYKGCHSV